MNATYSIGYMPKPIPNQRVLIYIFIGLLVSGLLSVVLNLSITLSLILGAQLTLLSLVIYRRVFLLGALLVGQLTASNFMVYFGSTQISSRFLWTILAVLMLLFIHFKEGKPILGKRGWKVMVPALILIICAIVSNLINTDVNYTLQYLRTAATALVIIMLVPAVINDEKDVKILGIIALTTCVVSAFFAILQHYHIGILPIPITIFGNNTFPGTRAIGLSENSVSLSFNLPLLILPALVVVFFNAVKTSHKVLLVLAMLIMGAAEYFTYTRSGMVALGAGFIALPLFMRSRMKWRLFAVALVLIASFLIYTNIKENRYTEGFTTEDSAAGRLILWQAGAKIAMASPVFGIGGQSFKEVAAEYTQAVSYDPEVVQAEAILGIEQPHNDFLRTWLSYGTIALIALCWLMFMIYRNFLLAYRFLTSRTGKAIALGCFAAFVTYAVSAFTHNVIDEVALLWVFGGFSAALCNIAAIQKQKQVKASE